LLLFVSVSDTFLTSLSGMCGDASFEDPYQLFIFWYCVGLKIIKNLIHKLAVSSVCIDLVCRDWEAWGYSLQMGGYLLEGGKGLGKS
jgi:hypothetical protein